MGEGGGGFKTLDKHYRNEAYYTTTPEKLGASETRIMYERLVSNKNVPVTG